MSSNTSLRKPLQAGALALALFASSCGGDSGSTEAQADDATSQTEAATSETSDDSSSTESASPANFTAPAVGGGTVDASAIEGDVVFWFWAPWWGTCRGEAPAVAEVANSLGDDVTIIGVGGKGSGEEDYADFVDSTGVGNIQHAIDEDGEIWKQFNIASQPAWAFVNDDGKIETNIGALGETALLERIEKLKSI